MAKNWLEIFFWVFAFLSTVHSECSLDTAMFMPSVVRVVDNPPGRGLSDTLATGNLITPKSVLTACLEIASDPGTHTMEVHAMQVHYSVGVYGNNQYQQAGSHEDTKGCTEIRKVIKKSFHPRCPATSGNFDLWDRDYAAFNIAVLRVDSPFRNRTEALPTMPFPTDVVTQLEMANSFNVLRTERCEIPIFNGYLPKAWYQDHMTFRSVPLLAECRPQLCLNKRRECNSTVANHTGYVLCARRVKQPVSGITWSDDYQKDTDLWDDNACESMKFIGGAPLVCRGMTIGIVTECRPFGLVISTIYAFRVFLVQMIERDHTSDEALYMDTSDIPTEKDDPVVQRSQYDYDDETPPTRLRTFAFSKSQQLRLRPHTSLIGFAWRAILLINRFVH